MNTSQLDPRGTRVEGSIEDDLAQPVKRIGDVSHRGVLAGVPLALVGVLILSSVAFGATLIQHAVAPATPTPVVVGAGQDDERSPAPTQTPSATATDRGPRLSTGAPIAQATEPRDSSIADMGVLVAADNLDRTVSFAWRAFDGKGLAGYELVYELTSSGKTPSYPGSATWASPSAGETSAAVAGIGPGDYQVRLQAICGTGASATICGQTNVIHVHLSAARFQPTPVAPSPVPPTSRPSNPAPTPTEPPSPPTAHPTPAPTAQGVADLGALAAADNLDMTVSFAWSPFTGEGLARYELVYELTSSGRTPSFFGGSPVWASTSRTSVAVAGIGPGSYQVRVEATCEAGGSTFVCGRTSVIRIHLSASRFASPTPAASAR